MKKGLLAISFGYLTILITTIQTIIITRKLGPVIIGQYSFFRQFSLLGAQIITLGIPSSLIYFISVKKIQVKKLLYTNIFYHLILSLLYLLVLWLFKDYFVSLLTSSVNVVLVIPFFYTLFVGVRNYFYNTLIAELKVKRTGLIDTLPITISFIFIIALLVTNNLTLYSWLFIDLILTPLLGSIMGLFFLKRELFEPVTGQSEHHISGSLFLPQVKYGFWMNACDFLLLLQFYLIFYIVNKLTNNLEEIGYYSRAFSIINIFVTSLMFIIRYFYATWAKAEKESKKHSLVKTLIVSFIMSLVAATVISIFSKEIVVLLFGKSFIPSATYLQILIFSIPFNTTYLLMSSFNNSNGETRQNVLQLTVSIIVFVALVAGPLHSFGLIGIAYAYLISIVGLNIYACVHLGFKHKINFNFYTSVIRNLIKQI